MAAGLLGRRHPRENSDVSPVARLVAVAERNASPGSRAGSGAVKFAFPAASVVTLTNPT